MRFFSSLSFFLLTALIHAQNLIVNPGFENFKLRKEKAEFHVSHREIETIDLPGWSDPSGTSDLYWYDNRVKKESIYENIPKPDSGSCFGGFWGCQNACDVSEYIQGTLTAPLEAGRIYRVSFSVTIDKKESEYQDENAYGNHADDLASLGIYFSDKLVQKKPMIYKFSFQPQAMPVKNPTDIRNWHTYYAYFRASGGEKFFIVGTFQSDSANCPDRNFKRTYIYVDNFELVATTGLQAKPDPIGVTGKNNDTTNYEGKWVFTDAISWRTGTNLFTQESYIEMNRMIAILEANPQLDVEIIGYVQSPYFLKRSTEKENAIAEYLVFAGIAPGRIHCGKEDRGNAESTAYFHFYSGK